MDNEKMIWNRYSKSVVTRLRSGSGLAASEWNKAAQLWDEMVGTIDGFTVDFGTGSGRFWQLVRNKPKRLILIDIATEAIKNNQAGFQIIANALNPPIKRYSADCIVALGLTEYVRDIEKLFVEWRELAIDGCKLLISSSPPMIQNRIRSIFKPHMFCRSDEDILSLLLNAGWIPLTKIPFKAGWQSIFVAITKSS